MTIPRRDSSPRVRPVFSPTAGRTARGWAHRRRRREAPVGRESRVPPGSSLRNDTHDLLSRLSPVPRTSLLRGSAYYLPRMTSSSTREGADRQRRRFPPLVDSAQRARSLLLPSLRFELRAAVRRLQSLIALSKAWRWEFIRLRDEDRESFEVIYLGRREERHHACRILNLAATAAQGGAPAALRSPRGILVSEVPLPGTLRVPKNVQPGGAAPETAGGYRRELLEVAETPPVESSFRGSSCDR